MKLDDFLDAFNWIVRIEGFVSSLLHFDKRAAREGAPVLGFASQLALSATGAANWTFHVPRDQGCTGMDVERLLAHYAIPIWCRRVTGKHFILTVPRRQANWAEYLILRRGMSLDGTLFNPDNQRYAQKYAPGDQPPAWVDRISGPGVPRIPGNHTSRRVPVVTGEQHFN
jgi:hypothetical protein